MTLTLVSRGAILFYKKKCMCQQYNSTCCPMCVSHVGHLWAVLLVSKIKQKQTIGCEYSTLYLINLIKYPS
jgi:hypothetical protein